MAKGFGSFDEAFKGFQPKASEQTPEAEVDKKSDVVQPPAHGGNENTEDVLNPEDEKFFQSCLSAFGLRGKDYWKVFGLIKDSFEHDVSYDISRYLTHSSAYLDLPEPFRTEVSSGINRIQKRGFAAAAKKWLESVTPEGMKYGRREFDQTEHEVKQYRLDRAEELANKAGRPLEELAKEMNLDLKKLVP